MAIIKGFINDKTNIIFKTETIADYTFDNEYLQIRTYKDNDFNRVDSPKQNFQLDKDRARELIEIINKFLRE